MENTLLRMAIGAAAMFALVAVPSVAAAATVVPPGNSAATQYTETFPTPTGNAEVNSPINGGRGGNHSSTGGGRSPEKVLGSHTAHRLEEQGRDGESVANLATEAAPETSEGGTTGASGGGGGSSGKHARSTGGSAGKPANGAPADATPVTGSTVTAAETTASGGSSGFSEVLSHATGSSSGEMGIFLPLVLLAVPLMALLYAWRRRHPDRAAS